MQNNKNKSVWYIGLLVGAIASVATIIYSVITDVFSLYELGWISGIPSYIITIISIVYSILLFKKNNDKTLTLGQGTLVGTVTSGVSGIIGGVFMYVYNNFVSTKMIDFTMEKAKQDMIAKGGLTTEQINQALEMSKNMVSSPLSVVMGLVGGVIIGVIISLTTSFYLRRS